jgi:hypothetical protein
MKECILYSSKNKKRSLNKYFGNGLDCLGHSKDLVWLGQPVYGNQYLALAMAHLTFQ